jgi:hypothetical protein
MVITLLFIGKSISLVLGWIGSFSYVLAYLLLTLNKLKSDQRLYHVLNIVGAVGLTVNAIFFQDFPNVIVNVFWGMIALMAILLIGRKKPG